MSEFDHFESALNVQEGIEQPEQVSPYLHLRKKRARTLQPADYYVQGILEGNRVILSQAITLIESVNPTHFQLAQEVIEKCLPYAGKSVRVGITGVPGVGKSTQHHKRHQQRRQNITYLFHIRVVDQFFVW